MFDRVLELIEKSRSFLVSGHVNPDGDCLGTQVALYHFLRGMGKEVAIVNAQAPDPSYDFLQRHTPFGVLKAGTPLPPHEVHVLTDCSTLDRLGAVGEAARARTGVVRLVVDHHVGSDEGDGDVLLWDVTACSSGSLVYDLFRRAGAPLVQPAAEGVFVSIVADTGWFRYSNTSDDALAICADLVAQGVKPHEIYNWLYRRKHPHSIELITEGMSRSRIELDGRLAVCELPFSYMQRAAEVAFDTDDLLDPLRSVRGVDVVLLLKEREPGQVKISLRASERVDVDGVARSFGGGGHRKAAGADIRGPLAQVRASVVGKVGELFAR